MKFLPQFFSIARITCFFASVSFLLIARCAHGLGPGFLRIRGCSTSACSMPIGDDIQSPWELVNRACWEDCLTLAGDDVFKSQKPVGGACLEGFSKLAGDDPSGIRALLSRPCWGSCRERRMRGISSSLGSDSVSSTSSTSLPCLTLALESMPVCSWAGVSE